MIPFPFDVGSLDDLPVEEEEAVEEPDEWLIYLNEEIEECFAVFDKDKEGEFDIKYLRKALASLGLIYTDTEYEEVEEALRLNGRVTLQSFHKFSLERLLEADALESLKIAFGVFDPEREGFLPVDRFKRWMTTLGEPLTDKEIKELVKLGDPGGKGIIAYDDLAALLVRR